MGNTVFYIQYYLTPSMTFIYRQLQGISEKFSVDLICSRTRRNTKDFYFSDLYYFPPRLYQKIISHIKDRITLGPGILSVNLNPVLYQHQIREIREFMHQKKPSLIHANFGPSGIEILPVAKELNIPLIVSFHGYDASKLLNSKVYQTNLKELFDYAFITTPSEYMLKNLDEKISHIKASEVIHYGIPLDFFHFVKRESPKQKIAANKDIIFLQVSNFVEKKGHKYTIEAFKAVVNEYSKAKLILAGDGYLKKENIMLSKQLGIYDKVLFPGYVNQNEVKDLMNKADVFVHHSVTAKNGDEEGIPNVIMEAMATGLPVISTFHAGIPELIEDGIDGYLVKERDVEDYSKKLLMALNDDDDIAFEARRKIEKGFNLELQNEKIAQVYSKIISGS